jgi:hypothetical protein
MRWSSWRIVIRDSCYLTLSIVMLLSASLEILIAGPVSSSIRVSPVGVTVDIDPGRGDNLGSFWTFSQLRSFALSPSPSGESKVGWQAADGTVHVTPLTSQDERKADDIIIGAGKLYDLVAHDDGFAVLIMKSSRMYIEKYNTTGTRLFITELTDDDDQVDD